MVIDDGLDDVLDVACALQECNGDDIPCLVVELSKCSFVRDVQCGEGVFQRLVVCGFVVVHIDDAGGSFLGAVKCVVRV